MDLYQCKLGCCEVEIKHYKPVHKWKNKKLRRKGGALIYDPETQSVLLIQSRGDKWGPPKGSINHEKESYEDCAMREVNEETGLHIHVTPKTKHTTIKGHAKYFYIEMPKGHISVQDIPGNDANGIMWVNTDCLADLITDGIVQITQHCRICLFRLTGTVLPDHPVDGNA